MLVCEFSRAAVRRPRTGTPRGEMVHARSRHGLHLLSRDNNSHRWYKNGCCFFRRRLGNAVRSLCNRVWHRVMTAPRKCNSKDSSECVSVTGRRLISTVIRSVSYLEHSKESRRGIERFTPKTHSSAFFLFEPKSAV